MYILFFTLIGLCYGSFINVLIYRLPKKKSIIIPRSFCPKCKKSIPFYRNIPILSFILQKGKCHNCNQSISIQYPIIEFISSMIWTLFALAFFNFNAETLYRDLNDFIFSLIIISFFIPLATIDSKYQYFPFYLLIPCIIISILYSLITFYFFNISIPIWGISFAFIFLILIYIITKIWFYLKSRYEEPMGMGDILLMIPIGAWLGPLEALFCIFISSLLALFLWVIFNYYKIILLNERMPFGPYLIISSIIIKISLLLF